MMNVMVFEPKKEAYMKQIDGSLESMQELVGGYIECVPLGDQVVLICDDEFLLKDIEKKEPTRRINGYPFYGTFFLCREHGEELESLTDAQKMIIEYYIRG